MTVQGGNTMQLTNFSNNLYTLRKQAGISQEELAERLNVSRQAISKWERGEACPDMDNLVAIAELFEVSLDALVTGADTSNTTQERTTKNVEIGNGKDDDDDDEDEDDEDEDDPVVIESKKRFRFWYDIPYPIVVTIAYLLWGFLADGWAVGWTLYVTIPVYYSIIDCIRRRRLAPFCYPVFITFVYLLMGMAWNMWHPWWILFISIPVFYPIANTIDKH